MRIFSFDGPVAAFFEKAGDIILTNLLFVLCCLPVITIGDAIGSMEYVFLARREGNDDGVAKLFFGCFRENWKRSVVPTLMMLAAVVFLYTDIRMFAPDGPAANTVLYIIFLAAGIIVLLINTFWFALLPFDRPDSWKEGLTDAVLMTAGNLPSSFLMGMLLVAFALLTVSSVMALLIALTLWVVCGFGIIGYVDSAFLQKAFQKDSSGFTGVFGNR